MNSQTMHGAPIDVPDNVPVHMKRTPQLGDTIVISGGEPLPQVDATFPEELRQKGPAQIDPAAAEGGLGENLGGHATASSTSPEKNILQTQESSNPVIDITQDKGTIELVHTQGSLSWTDGVKVVWLIRNEGEGMVHEFGTFAQAEEYFEANERTRWLIPGQDEEPGMKAADPAPGASEGTAT